MTDKNDAALVVEALTDAIAGDLERSIAALGYPVGMGLAPSPEECRKAAARIVERIGDKALTIMATRKEPA